MKKNEEYTFFYLHSIFEDVAIKSTVLIEKNQFVPEKRGLSINLNVKSENLFITENILNANLILANGNTEKLTLEENEFSAEAGIAFSKFSLPTLSQKLNFNWNDIKNFKIRSVDPLKFSVENTTYMRIYGGEIEEDLAETKAFWEIMKTYTFFKNYYEQIGNYQAVNEVTREMKDIRLNRLKWEYKTNPKLHNWFSWRLASLLKLYTEHGTDPAKALVISFWILLIFAVIYFFFPSDWDPIPKWMILGDMIKNWHDPAVSKPKAVILAFYYVGVSFLNSFMLSLNAFVTLGFGAIPTTGFARYLTIIQGFIGWFLLSIFTVALLNQMFN